MKRFLLLLVIFFPSCLSFSKKYNNLVESSSKYDAKIDSITKEYNTLKDEYDQLALRVIKMAQDTLRVHDKHKKLEREYNQLAESGSMEIASNQRQLRESKSQYREKQQALDQIATYINNRNYSMNSIQARCEESTQRYIESGVVVDRKDGSVVVFVPNHILYDSTEYRLSDSGKEFVISISRALAMVENISIVVGGHAPSDNPIDSSDFGDEWDLSAWRAIEITREIIKQKAIEPQFIYAAGHGAWGVMGESSGIKSAKTEIIITPILEEISQVIDRAINRN